jgi:hypothetical protein
MMRVPTPDFSRRGRTQFILQTTEVMAKRLSQVDEAFAWDEGQGNGTGNRRFPSPLFQGRLFLLFIALASSQIPDMRRPDREQQRFGR